MTARRIALPILALLVSAVAPGSRTRALAPILPEIRTHLDNAELSLSKGKVNEALAHCRVVLVATEIKVASNEASLPVSQRAACRRAIDFAIAAWEEALDGRVTFRVVEKSDDAQVVISFRNNVNLRGEPVAGLLNWKRTIRGQGTSHAHGTFTSEMQIRIAMPDGKPMPANAIRHTVTHEMGHVFGLEDTDKIGELMGPLNLDHPLEGPEPHEVAAVLAVRQHAERIRGEAERLLLK